MKFKTLLIIALLALVAACSPQQEPEKVETVPEEKAEPTIQIAGKWEV